MNASDLYARARAHLDDEELARLLGELRRQGWRAPLPECRRLAARLIGAGVEDREVLEQTGISVEMVVRMHRDRAGVARRPRSLSRSLRPVTALSAFRANGDRVALG